MLGWRRREYVVDAPRDAADGAGLVLSLAQRRRRAVYYSAPRAAVPVSRYKLHVLADPAAANFGTSIALHKAPYVLTGAVAYMVNWQVLLWLHGTSASCSAAPDANDRISSNIVSCARNRQTLAALAARPAVAAWLERELQALLLQGDVALVAQHVLAALRATSNSKAPSDPGRARGPAGLPASRRSAPAAQPPEDEVGSLGQNRKLWTPC